MNTSKWAKAFAIDYKGTLCSDDFEVDNDIFIRDCPFPTLNKGWVIQSDYVKGDCSLQYVDLYGSSYTTKCLIYSVAAGVRNIPQLTNSIIRPFPTQKLTNTTSTQDSILSFVLLPQHCSQIPRFERGSQTQPHGENVFFECSLFALLAHQRARH